MSPSLKIYIFPACTTCKKALKWLLEHDVPHQIVDIVDTPPDKNLLKDAISQFGSRKPLFNTSGMSYRQLGSTVVKTMTDNEALDALARDGKLIKRPFLVKENGQILVGFKPSIWTEVLLD